MNNKFSHTRNQALAQILSEFEVSPKDTLLAHLCPLAFCLRLNQGRKSPTPENWGTLVLVGTLSYYSEPPGEKLHVKVEKHRPPVASLEMICSHPFPEPGRGARPYMDTAHGALDPENVGVQGEAKDPWQGLPSKHSSPQEQASQRNGAFWPVLGTGGEVGAGAGKGLSRGRGGASVVAVIWRLWAQSVYRLMLAVARLFLD